MLALWTWLLLVLMSALVVVYLVLTTFKRLRRAGEPPIVKGSLVLGSAADFSQNAVDFLQRSEKTYGNVFTIRLINQYLTIIMDPNCYETMSSERNFDFDPIQKQVNFNVFNFVLKDAKKVIKETGKTVRGRFLEESMERFADNLNISCDRVPQVPKQNQDGGEREWSSDGLRSFAGRTIFDAIFNSVFGRADDHVFNSEMVCHNFQTYHKYFNYLWLGLPKRCFPTAMRALEQLLYMPESAELLQRPDLSGYIRTAISYMKDQGQTEADIKGHNLVYLHVNYNTYRLSFWALSNLLENAEAMEALMSEVRNLIEERLDVETNVASLSVNDVESLKTLDSIVQETFRLASGVFMVRYIREDTVFKTNDGREHLMRAGDRVAIYPPAIHKDPEIFEEPTVFKYDRFIDAKFYKDDQEVKHPVMGFGTLCPGKRFALLQIKWFLLTALTRFELKLRPGQHAEYDYQYHGHEILPPVSDVTVDFRSRDSFPVLKFEQR